MINICLVLFSIISAHGVINEIHIVEGDSSLYHRNEDTVIVDLNINGTHFWDFSDSEISWSEVSELNYVKNKSAGMFPYDFPDADLVLQTFSLIDTSESYIDKTADSVFAYGFTTVVNGEATPSPIVDGGYSRLMIFPAHLDSSWEDHYTMSSYPALIYVDSYVDVVDSGHVNTNIGNFHCVVVRIYQYIQIKVFGMLWDEMQFYRYDWWVDSLTSVATIQSRNDEINPNFTEAVRFSRVNNLSYYSSGLNERNITLENGNKIIIEPLGLKFYLNLENKSKINLSVYDVNGRLIAYKNLYSDRIGEVDIYWPVKLQTGIYFLNVKTNSNNFTSKLIYID